ncbi:MAG: polymer-forming cytoskeletal protein [Gemmatimonadetes bacterium]|nr:polymer-forming cytoskeletal protein [Gemmatimonadota bacterium]
MAGDLTVGPGVSLTGTVVVPGRAAIHGTLDGTLTARDVLVGPDGKVSGALEADTVELQGEGPATLTAKVSLVIRASGRVTGTVRYGRLEVEPGGVLQGDLAPLVNAATLTLDAGAKEARPGPGGVAPKAGAPGGGQQQGNHHHGGKKR